MVPIQNISCYCGKEMPRNRVTWHGAVGGVPVYSVCMRSWLKCKSDTPLLVGRSRRYASQTFFVGTGEMNERKGLASFFVCRWFFRLLLLLLIGKIRIEWQQWYRRHHHHHHHISNHRHRWRQSSRAVPNGDRHQWKHGPRVYSSVSWWSSCRWTWDKIRRSVRMYH